MPAYWTEILVPKLEHLDSRSATATSSQVGPLSNYCEKYCGISLGGSSDTFPLFPELSYHNDVFFTSSEAVYEQYNLDLDLCGFELTLLLPLQRGETEDQLKYHLKAGKLTILLETLPLGLRTSTNPGH